MPLFSMTLPHRAYWAPTMRKGHRPFGLLSTGCPSLATLSSAGSSAMCFTNSSEMDIQTWVPGAAGDGQGARDPCGEGGIAWGKGSAVHSCTEGGSCPLLLAFWLLVRGGFICLVSLSAHPSPTLHHPLSPCLLFSDHLFSSLSRSWRTPWDTKMNWVTWAECGWVWRWTWGHLHLLSFPGGHRIRTVEQNEFISFSLLRTSLMSIVEGSIMAPTSTMISTVLPGGPEVIGKF